MRELYFKPEAIAFLDSQGNEIRRYLIGAAESLAEDPFTDGVSKFRQVGSPESIRVWTDFTYSMDYEYDVPNETVIIWQISFSGF